MFLRLSTWVLGLTLTSSLWSQVELVRVWPGYRTAQSFTSLREYFGAPHGAKTSRALRSDPTARAGYYWLVRAKSPDALPHVTVRLHVTRAGDTIPEVHDFTTALPAGSQAFHVGLTGADWPDGEEIPVAWQIQLLRPDGTPLATSTSFLWHDATP